MRRKHLVQFAQAPANCNHTGLDESSMARKGGPSREGKQDSNYDDRDLAGRFWSHGECSWCMRRVAIARRHQARQMWLLARDLCTSAALHRVEGRGLAASRTLHLAFVVLRDRARVSEAAGIDLKA